MPRVMLRCPASMKLIYTGISMDEASYKNPRERMENHTTGCPDCGAFHVWSKEDTELERAPLRSKE